MNFKIDLQSSKADTLIVNVGTINYARITGINLNCPQISIETVTLAINNTVRIIHENVRS